VILDAGVEQARLQIAVLSQYHPEFVPIHI
jgi:hypothetical protein